MSHRLKVTWTTVFSHCDFKQNTCCALSRMSPPEPPEQPVPLGVADAMIDASKSLRTKKKVWTKISLLPNWTYFWNRLLPMLIEPVFDTSSMAPPPAAPFRLFLQEPGVKKQNKNRNKRKAPVVKPESIALQYVIDSSCLLRSPVATHYFTCK